MSLRYYKSNYFPEVDFSTDGRLSFSRELNEGTFPLSARGLQKYSADDNDITTRHKDQFGSLENRHRFQKNTGYRNGSVRSISTGTTSSRPQKNFDFNWLSDTSDRQSNGTADSGSLQFNSRASFGSADSKIARKKVRDMEKLEIAQGSMGSTDVDDVPLVKEVVMPVIERPPGIIYVIIGTLLVLVGIVNTVLCPWHLYWCSLWTGALVIFQGALGLWHRGSYIKAWQNFLYVVVGTLASVSASISIFLTLMFLVPFLKDLPAVVHNDIEGTTLQTFLIHINYTKWHPPVAESGATLVWLSLAFPAVIFVLLLASLHTLYGAILVFSNFWDCEYKTTGVCDHRRHPFWFNPVDFLHLGQSSLVVGMVCVSVSFLIPGRLFHWMPIASPVLICLSAFISFCFGKRPDILPLGVVSVLFELLSLASVVITLALLTMGCINDVTLMKEFIDENTYLEDAMFWVYVASLAVYGIYVVLSLVVTTYIIGLLVIHFKRLCSTHSHA